MPSFRSIFLAGAVFAAALPSLANAQQPQMPPPAVSVMTVKAGPLPVTYEYAGRVVASREVEVRARVGGILLKRSFEEGSRVKAGDVLFQIDAKPYQAEVDLAKAQLLQAQAQLSQAQRQEERTRELASRGATSKAALDDAVSASEVARANVAAAEAKLETANLSLQYATVRAPVGGITSLEQVPEGSLLKNGDLLTKISQLDPIYVNFSAADTEAAAIRKLVEEGAAAGKMDDLKVTLSFGDGSTYDKTGRIDFTSSSIDTQTGTILSRAVLPNPDQRLLPGQFVRVSISGITLKNAIVIPAEALMQSPQGPFVYTVDDKKLAQIRPIKLGRQVEGGVVVASGLKAGDTVITKGVVKVRPNAPVAIAAPKPGNGKPETPVAEAAQ